LARESFKEQMAIIIIIINFFYLSFFPLFFLFHKPGITPKLTSPSSTSYSHLNYFIFHNNKKNQIPSSSSQSSSHITTNILSHFFSQHNTKYLFFLCENTHKQHNTRYKFKTRLTNLLWLLLTLNIIFQHGGDVFRCGGCRNKLIQT